MCVNLEQAIYFVCNIVGNKVAVTGEQKTNCGKKGRKLNWLFLCRRYEMMKYQNYIDWPILVHMYICRCRWTREICNFVAAVASA